MFSRISEGLRTLYRGTLLPLEREVLFKQFHGPELTDSHLQTKPIVLVVGPYSTGKSSFIKHLLGQDYPGMRVGPEPTTDRFVALVHGEQEQLIPGHAAVSDKSLEFEHLADWGDSFLKRFQCARVGSAILERMTIIDTPGIHTEEDGDSGSACRTDLEGTVSRLAELADAVLVVLDDSKVAEVSAGMRRVLLAARGRDSKMHVILNKADRLTLPQLMHVHGALMWSLGQLTGERKAVSVSIGSFWNEPLVYPTHRALFETEERDLRTYMNSLQGLRCARLITTLLRRSHVAKTCAFTLDHLRTRADTKKRKQAKLLANLGEVVRDVAARRHLPLQDFPDACLMQKVLAAWDLKKLPCVDFARLDAVDQLINVGIPNLLRMVPIGMNTAPKISTAHNISCAQPDVGFCFSPSSKMSETQCSSPKMEAEAHFMEEDIVSPAKAVVDVCKTQKV
jgi:hypothetical protein